MGLYDFLYENKMTYDDFVHMIHKVREFVDFDLDDILNQTDELYDHDEYTRWLSYPKQQGVKDE